MEAQSEELARLPHPERMKRLMELGRQAQGDRGVKAAFQQMAAGGTFERWMAIKGCYTSRDGALVLAGVSDPSRRVRSSSRKLVALACDDGQAFEALKLVFATRQHHKMLCELRKRRCTAPIDAFLDWLRDQPGETLFCDVVPYGSASAVERHLGKALERGGFTFWDRMASYAPASLARLLLTQVLAQPGHPDSRLRWQLDGKMRQIAASAPDEVILLWQALRGRGAPVPAGVAETLLRGRPGPMTDALLASGERLANGTFAAVAHKLDIERLRRVAAAALGALGSPATLLARLPPAEREPVARLWAEQIEQQPRAGHALFANLSDGALRERVYQAWTYAARDRDGVIEYQTVATLPADLCEREARRHLFEVTQLATRPATRLPYAGLLPWEDALAALRDHMGHPDGDVRGPAVATLLRSAGRHVDRPALIDEALGMVKARKNEQDPVRALMLQALLSWDPSVWKPGHLASVGQIVRDGLDAADLSHHSSKLLEDLVLRVFRHDGAWGARWLTTLARERGRIHTSRLGDLLSDDEVRACAGPLFELAQGWAVRERDRHLMNLCRSLGARLGLVPGLLDLIEQVAVGAPVHSPAGEILMMFFRHDRARYDRLIGGMISRWLGHSSGVSSILSLAGVADPLDDALAAALVRVAREATHIGTAEAALKLLHEKRLELFYEEGPKLLAVDPSFILAPSLLWLAHRRRQDLLTPYLRGDTVQGRFATGKTGWVLPLTAGFERWSPEQQALYARTLAQVCADRERDTPTIGWAIYRLQDLGYTGGDQLISLADDDRAAIQEMAIRALSRMDAGQGVPKLLACMDDARARVAIYALRKAILEMPPVTAATVLQGVPLKKITVAKEVVRLLGELRTEEAYKALLGVARAVKHRDVRVALLRALWDHLERGETWEILQEAALGEDWILASRVGDIPPDRLSDSSERRLSRLLARVLDRPEPEARIDLLRRAHSLPIRDRDRDFYRQCLLRMESRYDDEIDAAVGAAVARATEQDVGALVDAVREVSLHRKVLQRVLFGLAALAPRSSVADQAARGALAMMANDALLAGLHAQVAARVLPLDALVAELDRVAARGWLDEFPAAALAPIGELTQPAQLAQIEATLAQREHYALRLAALKALEKQAAAQGWTPALRERLATFQRDTSPRVAIAAQFIFPPSEEPAPANRAEVEAKARAEARARAGAPRA